MSHRTENTRTTLLEKESLWVDRLEGRGGFVVSLFLMAFSLFCVSGCANLKETAKQIWGSSITHLEHARAEGKSEEAALPLDESFKKTEKILEGMGATVYLKDKDKKYLAAMNFKGHVDTTEVGIFFTKIEDRLTRIEVASMSPDLVKQVADVLFDGLKEKQPGEK